MLQCDVIGHCNSDPPFSQPTSGKTHTTSRRWEREYKQDLKEEKFTN